jgi:hypothetical protein
MTVVLLVTSRNRWALRGRPDDHRRYGGRAHDDLLLVAQMPKILRLAGTDMVWELDEAVDLQQLAQELVTARASNQFVSCMARLPGQAQLAWLTINPAQLSWWCVGEEKDPSGTDGVQW